MALTRLLDSVFLLALMVGFYPAIFFISNNWFFVGFTQSAYLLAALSLVSFIALSAVYLLISIGLPRRTQTAEGAKQYLRLPRDIRVGLIIILSAQLLVRSLEVTMTDLQNSYPGFDIRQAIVLAVSAIVIAVLLVARKLDHFRPNLIRFCNVFLLILSLAAVANLMLSTISNYDTVFADPELAVLTDVELRDNRVYQQVEFKTFPNIYLIVPDSYPSNPFLQTFFNFDNSKFSGKLQAQGFTLYDNYYASYPYSVESMHSMLAMQHSYFARSIGNDSVSLREVIGGTGNPVVSILKQNDYRSFFLHESDYLVKEHCVIEACLPEWTQLKALKENAKEFFSLHLPFARSEYEVRRAMQDRIAATDPASRSFTYKHFMDAHSTVKSYKERHKRMVPEFRKTFPDKIKKVNKVLMQEVEQIAAKDPSAIIVIVADHGTWAGAKRTKTGLTPGETLDKLNVFLAIKWGSEYDGRYDDQIKTSVNLFRYLFAWLSLDEAILDTRKDDDGFFKLRGKVWKVVENGEVVADPKRY